jgi:hypothetical protein
VNTPQKGGSARLSSRAPSAQRGLLERDAELAAISTLIDLTSDRGGVLVIEAPPGLGKTSLIVETKAEARGGGMQVLSARGAELEQAFSLARPRSRHRSSTPPSSPPSPPRILRWQRSMVSTG